MPWLVLAMASGFLADERFDLAVSYGRIAFPYILFISLAALLSGVSERHRAFRRRRRRAGPAERPVHQRPDRSRAGSAGPSAPTLAWTVPIAGVAQLALVWIAAARAGFRLTPRRPRLTPELKRLAIIAAPAALAGGVVQINLLIGRQVASFFDGAIAWLNYARPPLPVAAWRRRHRHRRRAAARPLAPPAGAGHSRRPRRLQPRRRDLSGTDRPRRRRAGGDPDRR